MKPFLLALIAHAFFKRPSGDGPKRRGKVRSKSSLKQMSVQSLEARDLMARVTWSVADGGNGHQYEFVATPANIVEARTLSQFMGGHLATINSPAENEFVRSLASNPANPQSSACWIGAFGGPVTFNDEHWEWVTGEPMKYQQWDQGAPNSGLSNESAVVLNLRNGSWDDLSADSSVCFIVEYDGLRDQIAPDKTDSISNDVEALATDLGSFITLKTVDASLRDVGDIDWYQFQSQTTGFYSIRVPGTPYPESQLFRWTGELFSRSATPSYTDYRLRVNVGETYRFAFGNTRVSEEFPYQIFIAPPGVQLPSAPVSLPTATRPVIRDLNETLADGATNYYQLTKSMAANIHADFVFAQGQGRLQVEIVNPMGEVLAQGETTPTGIVLNHLYRINDLPILRNDQGWPIFLKVTASGGEVSYTLNSRAMPLNDRELPLPYNLGVVSEGDVRSVAVQMPRRYRFTASESGPMHVIVSSSGLRPDSLQLVDAEGRVVATENSALSYQGPSAANHLSFVAEKGKEYDLLGIGGSSGGQRSLRLTFLGAPLLEAEPNNRPNEANHFGARSEWVVAANSGAAAPNGERSDHFEFIAVHSGLLRVGAENLTIGSMKVFINNQPLTHQNGGVREGDLIRYEVAEPLDVDYTIFGEIAPIDRFDDPYEYNEVLGYSTMLPRFDRDPPIPRLYDENDVDTFEFDTQPGDYYASVESRTAAGGNYTGNYRFHILNAKSGEIVANSVVNGFRHETSFVSFGGRYKMVVSAVDNDDFRPLGYLPEVFRVGSPKEFQWQTPLRATLSLSMGYFRVTTHTAAMGAFDVNYVGNVEVSFTSRNVGGTPFGTARVSVGTQNGAVQTFEITDGSSPIQLAVRPGRYFLGIVAEAPQTTIAMELKSLRVPGDANGDGRANLLDLALMRSQFNAIVPPFEGGDLNGDGLVNIEDFSLLRQFFNRRA